MKTRAEHAGLTHDPIDVCECDDIHCSCMGICRNTAEFTMYEMDENGNTWPVDDAGLRMCAECAFTAWENGTHASDENDDSDDEAISAHVSKLEKDMIDNIRDTDPERN